jgi:hypothetical protein
VVDAGLFCATFVGRSEMCLEARFSWAAIVAGGA